MKILVALLALCIYTAIARVKYTEAWTPEGYNTDGLNTWGKCNKGDPVNCAKNMNDLRCYTYGAKCKGGYLKCKNMA